MKKIHRDFEKKDVCYLSNHRSVESTVVSEPREMMAARIASGGEEEFDKALDRVLTLDRVVQHTFCTARVLKFSSDQVFPVYPGSPPPNSQGVTLPIYLSTWIFDRLFHLFTLRVQSLIGFLTLNFLV